MKLCNERIINSITLRNLRLDFSKEITSQFSLHGSGQLIDLLNLFSIVVQLLKVCKGFLKDFLRFFNFLQISQIFRLSLDRFFNTHPC